MKKMYRKPSIKVVEVETRNHLMQASGGWSIGIMQGETPQEAEAKKQLEDLLDW